MNGGGPVDIPDEVRRLALAGEKTRALKLLRETTDCQDLKTGRDVIDALAAGRDVVLPSTPDGGILVAEGVQGSLELHADRVIIKRKGVMAALSHGLKGDKEILLSSISSIQWRKPGTFTSGFIQFAFIGGQEAKGGLLQAGQDENTVMFTSAQVPAFQRIKTEIDRRRTAPKAQPVAPVASSPLDELERLASLKERGFLTDEEFNAKKRQLLGL
jgi:hypothetical protein